MFKKSPSQKKLTTNRLKPKHLTTMKKVGRDSENIWQLNSCRKTPQASQGAEKKSI